MSDQPENAPQTPEAAAEPGWRSKLAQVEQDIARRIKGQGYEWNAKSRAWSRPT